MDHEIILEPVARVELELVRVVVPFVRSASSAGRPHGLDHPAAYPSLDVVADDGAVELLLDVGHLDPHVLLGNLLVPLLQQGVNDRGVNRPLLEVPQSVGVGLKHLDVGLLLTAHEVLGYFTHRHRAVRRAYEQVDGLVLPDHPPEHGRSVHGRLQRLLRLTGAQVADERRRRLGSKIDDVSLPALRQRPARGVTLRSTAVVGHALGAHAGLGDERRVLLGVLHQDELAVGRGEIGGFGHRHRDSLRRVTRGDGGGCGGGFLRRLVLGVVRGVSLRLLSHGARQRSLRGGHGGWFFLPNRALVQEINLWSLHVDERLRDPALDAALLHGGRRIQRHGSRTPFAVFLRLLARSLVSLSLLSLGKVRVDDAPEVGPLLSKLS